MDLDLYIDAARRKDQLGWDNDDDRQRYILVEESRYDGSYYVTTFETLFDAAEYHDTQEYPEDWIIETLIDTKTSKRYYAVQSTTWELKPE